MFTSCFYNELPLVILSKVKEHFYWRIPIRKGDSLAVQFQELDPNVLKIPLFDRYVKSFAKGMLALKR